MDRANYSTLRIMLLAGKTHSVQTLRAVLAIAGVTRIIQVDNTSRAMELLSVENYDAVFADVAAEPIGGLTFPLAVRNSGAVLNPMVPVFVFHERAYRRAVEKARDTGATDFITCPMSPKTIMTKLEAALANPRPFIKAPEFFGPDRRAKARPTYHGTDRRSRVPRKIKVQLNGREAEDSVLI